LVSSILIILWSSYCGKGKSHAFFLTAAHVLAYEKTYNLNFDRVIDNASKPPTQFDCSHKPYREIIHVNSKALDYCIIAMDLKAFGDQPDVLKFLDRPPLIMKKFRPLKKGEQVILMSYPAKDGPKNGAINNSNHFGNEAQDSLFFSVGPHYLTYKHAICALYTGFQRSSGGAVFSYDEFAWLAIHTVRLCIVVCER